MKARIINSNYEVDVQPHYQEGWFMGFTETSNPKLVIYRPQDLEFQDDKEVGSKPDWSSFRREVAKDILCALAGNKDYLKVIGRIEPETMLAIQFADELIQQLKESHAREND